jgi:hypothetical protein
MCALPRCLKDDYNQPARIPSAGVETPSGLNRVCVMCDDGEVFRLSANHHDPRAIRFPAPFFIALWSRSNFFTCADAVCARSLGYTCLLFRVWRETIVLDFDYDGE